MNCAYAIRESDFSITASDIKMEFFKFFTCERAARNDPTYRIQFPKGRAFAPDPRMAEVPNRLNAMTQGNVGIAMVEVLTTTEAAA